VEIPKNILYNLFLRNCYKGPTIGSPHKIGYGNACKNCGFQFPVSPDIIDPEKEGKPASRYLTFRNKKTVTERIEKKKYNPFLKRHTLHKEIK
jgi:large subunit ribosomal protein L33